MYIYIHPAFVHQQALYRTSKYRKGAFIKIYLEYIQKIIYMFASYVLCKNNPEHARTNTPLKKSKPASEKSSRHLSNTNLVCPVNLHQDFAPLVILDLAVVASILLTNPWDDCKYVPANLP